MARYVFANGHRARPLNSVVRHHVNRLRRFLVLGAIAASSYAQGMDFVSATYQDFDCLLCAAEKSEIVVSRITDPGRTKVEVDRYFDRITDQLRKADMPLSWKMVSRLHADEVRVEIQLGGSRYSLSAPYERSGGIISPPNESAVERRRRQALEAILVETARYTAARYIRRESK